MNKITGRQVQRWAQTMRRKGLAERDIVDSIVEKALSFKQDDDSGESQLLEQLIDLAETVSAGNTEYEDLEVMANVILEGSSIIGTNGPTSATGPWRTDIENAPRDSVILVMTETRFRGIPNYIVETAWYDTDLNQQRGGWADSNLGEEIHPDQWAEIYFLDTNKD